LPKLKKNVLLILIKMRDLANKTFYSNIEEKVQLPLFVELASLPARRLPLASELAAFREFGQTSRQLTTAIANGDGATGQAPTFFNEFWTARSDRPGTRRSKSGKLKIGESHEPSMGETTHRLPAFQLAARRRAAAGVIKLTEASTCSTGKAVWTV
jgi:hypothetical protein